MKFLGTFNFHTQSEEISELLKSNPKAKGFYNPYAPTVSYYIIGK